MKAMAKKLTWIEAAEIAGMSVRNMQRKRQGYIDYGYNRLADHRRGKLSYHRIPMATAAALSYNHISSMFLKNGYATLIPDNRSHGTSDGLVTYGLRLPENSVRLEKANPEKTQLWIVPGSHHADAWSTTGSEFERRVLDFYAAH